MKQILYILFAFTLTNCGDACQDDCPPSPEFRFQIIEENTNLSGKENYSKDSLSIIGVYQNSTKIEISVYLRDESSNPYFSFGTNIDTKLFQIEYQNGSTDTISLDYVISDDECCNQVVSDYSAEINGIKVCDNCSDEIIRIKK